MDCKTTVNVGKNLYSKEKVVLLSKILRVAVLLQYY